VPDLMNRLASLHEGPAPVTGDDVLAADLRRARVALAARRRRRAALAGGTAALAIAAAGSLAWATASGGAAHGPGTPGQRTVARPAAGLVAYRGGQLPGYSVKVVPAGYVLQGITGSVLDIARAGDHSSLDIFIGKITVTLNDHPGLGPGTRVTVNGQPGRLQDQAGTRSLTYRDGSHYVDIQAWSTIHITPAQLVRFADGVTVLPGAQVSHG